MEDFKCKKCGKCCSNLLPLSNRDRKEIRKYMKGLNENRLLAVKDWYSMCPFLNHKNQCDIYEHRPTICREYSCYNYDNRIVSEKFVEAIQSKNFSLTDMREEFFGG